MGAASANEECADRELRIVHFPGSCSAMFQPPRSYSSQTFMSATPGGHV
jgi:hypothetical protein